MTLNVVLSLMMTSLYSVYLPGLGCSKLWLNLMPGLANQWLNLITVGYLTSGQICVPQNELNQWLANHWLNGTNHWLNDLTSG